MRFLAEPDIAAAVESAGTDPAKAKKEHGFRRALSVVNGPDRDAALKR
jgi:hypothetical protein